MKRTLIGIGAVLYLAACWAPQLWTASADAQEKAAPKVLEEVRARRFVLVDGEGKEIATLDDEMAGPTLLLQGKDGVRAVLGIMAGEYPMLGLTIPESDDAVKQDSFLAAGAMILKVDTSEVEVAASQFLGDGPGIELTNKGNKVAALVSRAGWTSLALLADDGSTVAELAALSGGYGGQLSVSRRSQEVGCEENRVRISAVDFSASAGPTDVAGLLDEHYRDVQRSGLTMTFRGAPEISIRSADGKAKRSETILGANGLDVESNGQTRAQVGKIETVSKRTGAETTQEGAFVSYDADGNVLWMEPR